MTDSLEPPQSFILQLSKSASCSTCEGSEERLGNITYFMFKFLTVKTDPLNVVSHYFAVYKGVSTKFNDYLV
jgi:hypothetical protein